MIKIKNILILGLSMVILTSPGAFADAPKNFNPSAEAQNAFMDSYADAYRGGEEAFADFQRNVTANGTEEERGMLENMNKDKMPDGSDIPEGQGFLGDPRETPPSDWSNYDIETDADGNVTGIKEKDFDKKDKDGDGEISDEERDEYEENKKKEEADTDGDGEVSPEEQADWDEAQKPPKPDWDQDGNGFPDVGFELWCWQCTQPPDDHLHECGDGWVGACPGSCSENEECSEWQEGKPDGCIISCHACQEKKDDPCEAHGFTSDPNCDNRCPKDAAECEAVYISPDGTLRTSTALRGDLKCYRCKDLTVGCEESNYMTQDQCSDYCHGIGDCVPGFVAPNGEPCYECHEKNDERNCYDIDKNTYVGCQSWCEEDGGRCIEDGIAPNGEICWKCYKLEELEDCTEYGYMSLDACSDECHGVGDCVPSLRAPNGDNCYECVKPDEKGCAESDLMTIRMCESFCMDDGGHCVEAGKAPNGETCWECVNNIEDKDCSYQEEMNEGDCRDWCEGNNRGTCVKSGRAANGEQCFYCQEPVVETDPCEEAEALPGACPGTCSEGQDCEPVNIGNLQCHNCYDKEPDPCEKEGLTPGACPGTCSEDETCSPVDVGGSKCHNCYPKIIDEKDKCEEAEALPGACPGACSEDQDCEPVNLGDGTPCHQCVEKEKENCADIGKLNTDACDGCVDSGEHECKPDGNAPSGEACFKCVEKPKPKRTCADEELMTYDDCSTCISEGGKCTPLHESEAGERCYRCDKDETPACSDGYSPGKCYPITCSEGQVCRGAVMNGKDCHICEESSIEEDDPCEKAEALPGGCPGTCSEDEECAPVTTSGGAQCHNCHEKEKKEPPKCEDEGLNTGVCPGSCATGQTCSPVDLPGGVKCHNCYSPIDLDESSCVNMDAFAGPCPGACTEGYACEPVTASDGKQCHNCIPKEKEPARDPCYYSQRESGGCPGTCTSDTICEEVTLDGQKCHWCKVRPITGGNCDQGYASGACDAHACASDEKCFEVSGPCHTCQKWTCDPPLLDADGCQECHASGGRCMPMLTLASEVGNAPPCYRCEQVESCEKYGELSTCGMCKPGTICIPGRVIRDSYSGESYQCVNCLVPETVEVEYLIVIVESPLGRFVLGKEDKDQFEASSVMALSKVDAMGQIQNAAGDLKKLTDFMGGFNVGLGPAGLATTGKIGMSQLSSILQDKLTSGGSFGQDCFGDAVNAADQQAAEAGMPTSEDILGTSKERKKDKDKRESEVFSKEQMKAADDAGDPAITGPIVACGNEGRDKVLKIYDAAGALIDTITKDMLELNPGIIQEKLGLAQTISDISVNVGGKGIADYIQKFTGLPVKDMQSTAGLIQKYKSMADQAVSVAASKKKKKVKKIEEPDVYPNDPLYTADPKKKKRRRSAAGLMGATIKMGLGALEARDNNKLDVPDQWGLHEIGFTAWDDPESAWNVVNVTEKNIVVAVVDSGLDFDHEDAPEHIWTNPKEIPGNGIDDDKNGFVDDIHGWNFVTENHDFTDIRGHGTFVAGIIAAKINNGVGIAGINPGAVIMPVVVADEEGETDSFAIFRGINYAANHGAKVINVSLGARAISKMEQAAIARAQELGALVVVAAGNTNDDIREFGPSSSKNALSVGQIDFSGERSTVSSWGANLGLVAPGEQIYSLCSKDNKHVKPSIREIGYYKQDGTSFATPMVAATASLIWAKNPGLTNDQVRDIILATAVDMDEPGWDGMTGAGLLDASAALRADVDDRVRAMITNLRVNRDVRDDVISVDVYGSVRGDVKEYFVEVGKGKSARRFDTVAGPFRGEAIYKLIERINVKDHMRGSRDWVIRIRAVGNDGEERLASTPFDMPK